MWRCYSHWLVYNRLKCPIFSWSITMYVNMSIAPQTSNWIFYYNYFVLLCLHPRIIIIIFYVYHHKYSHWLCLQANKQIGEPTNKGAATNRYQIPTSFATSKANVRVVSSCFRWKYENIFILCPTHPACVQVLDILPWKAKYFQYFGQSSGSCEILCFPELQSHIKCAINCVQRQKWR